MDNPIDGYTKSLVIICLVLAVTCNMMLLTAVCRLGGRLAGRMAPRYAKDKFVGNTMHMAFPNADEGMTQTVAKYVRTASALSAAFIGGHCPSPLCWPSGACFAHSLV